MRPWISSALVLVASAHAAAADPIVLAVDHNDIYIGLGAYTTAVLTGGLRITTVGLAPPTFSLHLSFFVAAPIVVTNVTVDPTLANDIITGPAGFYFNVHSTINGGDVIRGQLTPGS